MPPPAHPAAGPAPIEVLLTQTPATGRAKLRPLLAQLPEQTKQADLYAAQCYEQLGETDKQLEACRRVLSTVVTRETSDWSTVPVLEAPNPVRLRLTPAPGCMA